MTLTPPHETSAAVRNGPAAQAKSRTRGAVPVVTVRPRSPGRATAVPVVGTFSRDG
ncbi:hypothetical protein [Streptomyces sp. 8N706]|uniref:hypothetical protein n=1 Tax=Streptomyces sp. 8N706 TaxID=3457416 RepID=UPI003FD108E1